jgi:hypothetical protein
VLLVLAVAAFDGLIDGFLRDDLQRRVNASLVGYSTRIGAVDLSPWNGSLDLMDFSIRQQSHPEPPVAYFPRVTFSVHWRSLLFGRLVGDCTLESPDLHFNLPQLREEWRDEIELEDRGWQDALEALFPLKINELEIVDGSLTYVDNPDKPLQLTGAHVMARNIRNVISPERTYPSTVSFESDLFETGVVELDGRANFLAKPFMAVVAGGWLEDVPLDRLEPVLDDYRLILKGGILSAHGQIEYAPWNKLLDLKEAFVRGIQLDYVQDPELTAKAVQAIEEFEDDPTEVRVQQLRVLESELGFVNEYTRPPFRLFASEAELTLRNLSNQSQEGDATIEGRALFMGSGATTFSGTFRPDHAGPDFDIDLAIRDAKLASMNDLLRAYANLDVTEGWFSFFSELRVRDGTIDGYVKPLFRDINVYDPRQDRSKNVFRKMYEGLADGVAKLLENKKRDEVVTVAELSGRVDSPEARNLQVVLNLIQNGFFEAILPGFEREAGAPKKDKKR